MRVTVDLELCEGHGQCVMAAPEVFDIPPGADVVSLLQENPPEALRAQVEQAAATCPVAAILIEG